MKETCQNLVRSVVQREDLQIQKENSGKENRMLNLSRIWIGDQCDRWNELRSVLRVETNTEVAKILLDWQVQCLHFNDENKSYIVANRSYKFNP